MKLKEYRKKFGLTQEQIANVLGIPTKTYQNYERGVREADSDVLCSLAEYYCVSLDDLFGRTETNKSATLDAQKQELIRSFDSLGAEGRAILVDVAHSLFAHLPKKHDCDIEYAATKLAGD